MRVEELGKDFETKEAAFEALKSNVDRLIQTKKSRILKSCEKGLGIAAKSIDASKLQGACKDIDVKDDHYYIAVNTTKILDSHGDLHVNGIWNKTVKEQKGKNYLVLDHLLTISDTVVTKDNIQMMVKEIPFSLVGKPYDGNTQALIYAFHKDNIINEDARKWLEKGRDIEASVRMQYVNIDLAINSDEKEDKKYKDNYDKYFNEIANKDEYESIDYFWIVKEAKNVHESSLVLFGSNSATGNLSYEKSLYDEIQEFKQNLQLKINNKTDASKAGDLLSELIAEIKKPHEKSTSIEPPLDTQTPIDANAIARKLLNINH